MISVFGFVAVMFLSVLVGAFLGHLSRREPRALPPPPADDFVGDPYRGAARPELLPPKRYCVECKFIETWTHGVAQQRRCGAVFSKGTPELCDVVNPRYDCEHFKRKDAP